jgi:hypothetical protein
MSSSCHHSWRFLPTIFSGLRHPAFPSGWADKPKSQFTSGNTQLLLFLENLCKEQNDSCSAFWLWLWSGPFFIMKAVESKVSIFLLEVRQRSMHKVFLSENAHTGVPLSSLEC